VPASGRFYRKRVEDYVTPSEFTAAIVLHKHRTIVIMRICVLFSRRPAEAMAYVVLPGPGMIG
jgi:hypothetical protein